MVVTPPVELIVGVKLVITKLAAVTEQLPFETETE
jgi:hypothetical protein